MYKADSRFVPSQWVTALLCNAVSYWLGANLESALMLCHVVKSLQLIWRSGTHRFHLQVLDFLMTYLDLTLKIGHQDNSHSNGHKNDIHPKQQWPNVGTLCQHWIHLPEMPYWVQSYLLITWPIMAWYYIKHIKSKYGSKFEYAH